MFSLCLCASVVSLSCGSKPIDPRTVVPGDALVYLETRDLGAALRSITESDAFARISKKKPDLSAISSVKMSVAVTGFETSEKAESPDGSILNFQPRFVAVIETNAWSWQTTSFIEDKLGEFINDVYGGGVELVVTRKDGGEFYVWTSQDGRKAFALQQGSLVLFGNDETAIEKCQAVRRGEAESIAKNPKVTDGDRIAFGYVSPDGLAQLANIEGVSIAMEAGEDAEVKSFIARVLPEILRTSVTDLAWSASRSASGIEDSYDIGLNPQVAQVFAPALTSGNAKGWDTASFVPYEAASVTRYDLADARIAWQSLLNTLQTRTDAVNGKLISAFSVGLFEPYAIENADLFLVSIRGPLTTVKLDIDSDDVAVIALSTDIPALKKSVAKEISFAKASEKIGDAEVWRSADGNAAVAVIGYVVILGDAAIVRKCLASGQGGKNFTGNSASAALGSSSAAIASFTGDAETPPKLSAVLGEPSETKGAQPIIAETRFDQTGMQRKVTSDFGLVGTLIAQFAAEAVQSPQ